MADPTRRTLLRSIGVAAAATAAPALLSACGGGSGGGGDKVSNKGTKLAPWPTYTKKTGPTPDLPGDLSQGVQDAYLKYPSQLAEGTNGTPGDGSTISVLTISYGTPTNPESKNKYWQAVEKELGVKIKFTAVPAADYQTKLTTLMAGGNIPDMINFGGGVTLAHLDDFVVKTMTDLTPYLSGDNIKDYPNLANIPTSAWRQAGRFRGNIYGIPIDRARPGAPMWVNSEAFEKNGMKDGWTRDDYSGAVQAYTTGKKFGCGGAGWGIHAACHGMPNGWSVEGGKFVTQYDAPQVEDTLSFVQNLYKKGWMYRESMTASTVDMKTRFYNGSIGSYQDGYGALITTLQSTQGFTGLPAAPYQVSGAKSIVYASSGSFGYTVLNKNLSKAKVKMILSVLDKMASPFGTKEYELINYGVEGVHFTRDKDGSPVATDLGKVENVTNLPFQYMVSAPQVLYVPGHADAVKKVYEWEKKYGPTMLMDPTVGLRSDTNTNKGASIGQGLSDTVNAIITGKAAVSSLAPAVKKWKSAGGDKIAAEFAAEYAGATTK